MHPALLALPWPAQVEEAKWRARQLEKELAEAKVWRRGRVCTLLLAAVVQAALPGPLLRRQPGSASATGAAGIFR